MASHVLFFRADALTRRRGVLLDHVGAEVEELLEREQMLVGLLAPLAESDQHEIFLQVPFLFSQRVKPRVLDRDSGLQRQALRTLHLLGREGPHSIAFGQHGRADGLAVCHQRQREQRAHAERAGVAGAHEIARAGVLDHDGLAMVENLEQERGLRALAVLPAPEVFLVGGGGAEPALAILFI